MKILNTYPLHQLTRIRTSSRLASPGVHMTGLSSQAPLKSSCGSQASKYSSACWVFQCVSRWHKSLSCLQLSLNLSLTQSANLDVFGKRNRSFFHRHDIQKITASGLRGVWNMCKPSRWFPSKSKKVRQGNWRCNARSWGNGSFTALDLGRICLF